LRRFAADALSGGGGLPSPPLPPRFTAEAGGKQGVVSASSTYTWGGRGDSVGQ
jgi:hypothetical protein